MARWPERDTTRARCPKSAFSFQQLATSLFQQLATTAVLTLCQGKESTPVMPANFEHNVVPKPTGALPPTHEQAVQRLAAANAVMKAAQQVKAAASDKLAAAQRDDYAAT